MVYKKFSTIVFLFILTFSLFVLFFSFFNSKTLTIFEKEKIIEFRNKLEKIIFPSGKIPEEEIEYISKMNHAYSIYSNYHSILKNEDHANRELIDLINLKFPNCYIMAYIFEKVLESKGFKTRHIFLTLNEKKMPKPLLLFMKLNSHALLEVKTKRGWLIVDPYQNWQGVTNKSEVINIQQLKQNGVKYYKWKKEIHAGILNLFFQNNFEFFYGLYSRKGGIIPSKISTLPVINAEDLISSLL